MLIREPPQLRTARWASPSGGLQRLDEAHLQRANNNLQDEHRGRARGRRV
ncbi:MAG: hypothetical protein ACI9U2_002600 [Bradymonadia bacterium]|jgi:hypothetical protein